MLTRSLLILFLVSLASVLDVTLAPRLALCFAKPSFVVILVAILAVYSSPPTASFLGFLAGLMVGGLANENLSAHVVSLTLMAYGVSRFFPLAVARTRTAVALMAFGGSLGASLVFLLFVPERHILWWFRDTIGDAGYNALLTWLLCPIGRGVTRIGSRR